MKRKCPASKKPRKGGKCPSSFPKNTILMLLLEILHRVAVGQMNFLIFYKKIDILFNKAH